jgi:dipeptidyl aminopeptidase/acylaminoacyl peptidase
MRRSAAALLGLLGTLAASSQPLPAEVVQALRPYAEFRAYRLQSWHPGGREVLVSRRDAGDLLRVDSPGAAPQPIAVEGRVLAAAFQPPHGDSIVYLAEGPDGSRRLYRHHAEGTSAVSPADEQAMEFAWNPEGDRIAYATVTEDPASAARTRTTVRIVDPARALTERFLGNLDGRWKDLRFSPNGRRIALTQEVSTTESHLWVMDVATGTRRRVTRPQGKAPGIFRSPVFSRDGRSLFALSDRGSEYLRLVTIPVGGGAFRTLTAHLNHDVESFAASEDAGLIAFVTNEGGSHVVRFIDLVTLKEQPRPSLLDGVVGGLAWKPKSREIGFHVSSARTAGDVFSYEARANQVTRWTNGNAQGVNVREFGEPKRIKWKGGDGREITGLLYAPPAKFAGKRPVIVDHRAGVGSQWRTGFLGRANYVVNDLGVAIIRPNVRGSSGFGKAFAALTPQDAYRDIASLLEWIGKQPSLDESRTLVIGTGAAGQPDDDGFMAAAIDFARRHQ